MKKSIKSLFLTATLAAMAMAGESETFGGLGLSVWTGKDGVKIVGIIPNSPAENIGLQAGDLIVSANGTEFSAVEPAEQVSYLRGKAGTSVNLIVERKGEKLSLSAKRAELAVQSLDAKEISEWYGKNNGLTAEEISFLASQRTTDGYELLAVMQHGVPISKSAENLKANAFQQISIKKAEEVKLPEAKPVQVNPYFDQNGNAKNVSLVNAKGAKVKKQGNMPLYKTLK
jgi:membrane-associated protease RseP (regulator of RpoE activity)